MNAPQQFCTFFVDRHCFGIPVEQVQEVLRDQEMTSVPLAPPEVSGLINLRGQIVMVIDLHQRLQLPNRNAQQHGTNVVVRAGNEVVSLLADAIDNVQDVDPMESELPPDTVPAAARELITGTYKLPDRLLLVLDVGKVADLSDRSMR